MDIKRCRRDFPEEIIEEIVLRLPVESLLRFRCVSKSWRRLFDSERFIGRHLKVSRKSPSRGAVISGDFIERRIILELFGERVCLFMVGCCNGLVCMSCASQNQVYLWNPFTRITKALPCIKSIGIWRPVWFDWDESSEAYKVCAFNRKGTLMVYSSKTNSWKTVAARVCDSEYMHYNGVLLRGKVHWSIANWKKDRCDIVSFDLKSEAFGVVEMQSDVHARLALQSVSVGVVGECLCLVRSTAGNKTVVWVMKEYGVKESWFKFMDHGPDPRLTTWYSDDSLALAKVPDGEIVLTHARGFFVRDPLNQIHHFCCGRLCVQSLVSPCV